MKKIGIFVLLFSCLIYVSCKKEGCVSNVALNYNPDANTDDGSCQYDGQVATTISQVTKDNLLAAGIDGVDVYVDGEFAGLIDLALYYPDSVNLCGEANLGSKVLTWTGHSAKRYEVIYKDEATELAIDTSYVNVQSSVCNYSVLIY